MTHFPIEEIKRLRAINAELLEACKEMAQWIADETSGQQEDLSHWLKVITKAEA